MQRPPNEAGVQPLRPDPRSVRDLRGGVRLAFDAVRRSLDRVEEVHGRLADVSPPVRGVRPGRPGQGWPAVVYRGLRGSTDLVGGGVDLALASLQAWAQEPRRTPPGREATPTRDAAVAALNAIAGDHLHRTDNPLAIRTDWHVGTPRRTRVLVLLPDLGLDAAQWCREGAGFGDTLASALDATPACLRYNAGRHVWAVAREVASSLEQLLAGWPLPVQGVDLLGHGHGGLVLRSALHQAVRSGQGWPALVRHVVFLGTPHAGATLGRRRDLLQAVASGTHAGLLLARLRGRPSEGIDDFVHGQWLEQGVAGSAASAMPSPWPPGVRAYAVAGTVGDQGDDGVVPVASALGRGLALGQDLELPEGHRWTAPGTDHLSLIRSDAVLQQVRQWLSV